MADNFPIDFLFHRILNRPRPALAVRRRIICESFSAIYEWWRISLCSTIVCCRGLRPKTTVCWRNSDGRFAQIAARQYSSMAGPTLPDCRLPKLRRHHRATAGQAQTRTYPRQRSSTGSRFPYRFRPDTGPCVGTGEGLANSGKEIRDSKAAPQHGELRTNLRSCQKGGSCFG